MSCAAASTLDICTAFNRDTKAATAATKGSHISAAIVSRRDDSSPLNNSGTVTSSARANFSSEDSVGDAFSFSSFEIYVRGTDMRAARSRWLQPPRSRSERIDVARVSITLGAANSGWLLGTGLAGSGHSEGLPLSPPGQESLPSSLCGECQSRHFEKIVNPVGGRKPRNFQSLSR